MTETSERTDRRAPLTKERVLQAAVALADRDGIDALSMRKLGQELSVDPMALYRHVRNKDDIIDGIVDAVIAEIEVPPRPSPSGWKASLRAQMLTARRVMLRHPWAPRAIVDRTTTSSTMLAYIESVLAKVADGGFSVEMAHHSLHVLGSRILGFTQDPFEDSTDPAPTADESAAFARAMADRFPRIADLAMSVRHGGALGPCDDDVEFEFGVDLILDGLDRRR